MERPDAPTEPGRDDPGGDASKLVPGWRLGADAQIFLVGLAVAAVLLGLAGWNLIGGGDGSDDEVATVGDDGAGDGGSGDGADTEGADGDGTGGEDADGEDTDGGAADGEDADGGGAGGEDTDGDGSDDDRAAGEDADGAAGSVDPTSALRRALGDFGGLEVSAAGGVATLTGVVGTSADSDDAETAAAGVEGIEEVDNQLVVLEPEVRAALDEAGVADAEVEMDDTAATVRGVLEAETARPGALDAAAAVPGVTRVIDELEVAEVDLQPAVEEAVAGPGDIRVTVDGDTAVLEGHVGTAAESSAAEEAAAAVEGIETVDNRLVVLAPEVRSAVGATGVDGVEVSAEGTVVTLTGTVASEEDRAAAVAAAGAVAGVTEVVDRLEVDAPVADAVNEVLEADPVQFATNQAVILPTSLPVLDRVVEILAGGTYAVEVQGFTDVRGDEAANLALSQARADAVLAYLAGQGVDVSGMRAVGYGETDQFGAGDSPQALAANRRVRFQMLG